MKGMPMKSWVKTAGAAALAALLLCACSAEQDLNESEVSSQVLSSAPVSGGMVSMEVTVSSLDSDEPESQASGAVMQEISAKPVDEPDLSYIKEMARLSKAKKVCLLTVNGRPIYKNALQLQQLSDQKRVSNGLERLDTQELPRRKRRATAPCWCSKPKRRS